MLHGKKNKWGWRVSWKKDVGIDSWLENKILEIPTPSRLLWFTVSTATTSTTLWVFSAHSGFPPFMACVSATFLHDSCCVVVSQRIWKRCELTLFFIQDRKKKKKNTGCVIVTLAHWSMSSVLRCRARGLAHTPFQSYLSACPPTPLAVVNNNSPRTPNCFTRCRNSP